MRPNDDFFTRKYNEVGVSLNAVQRQAVLHHEGPLLLLASPGSGKTTTLMMRIGYLIEEKGINPARIKAVTFSRASARDMEERFLRLFPELAGARVNFSTIHSLAFEVVRTHYRRLDVAYQLIEGDINPEEEAGAGAGAAAGDESQPVLHKRYLIRQIYRSVTGNQPTDDQMDELTTYISYVKNKMLPESRWAEVKCEVKEADKLLKAYETFKRKGTDKLLLDFDDMLTVCNEAFVEDASLLRRFQNRYDFLLTDESQDTSLVQFAIIDKLAASHGNLCVVADDDQSIYGWRGAEPQYLLDFRKSYPSAELLKMEQNYRSSPEIVKAASRFIQRNRNRYDKRMFTENPSSEPIRLRALSDFKEQAPYLIRRIAAMPPERRTAILYRNHTSSIVILNAFDRAGIPFYMKDGDDRFFSHWVVEDVLNFMRMAYTDKRPELFAKIHSKMSGYVTKEQIVMLGRIRNQESVFDNLINQVELKDYQVKQLKEAQETFGRMKAMNARQAIRTIRYNLGYERALDKLCERFGFRQELLLGVLNTLEDIADGLETMTDFANRLKYLERIMKASRFRKREDAVTFSTFHSAKGLEFDEVFLIDLAEGVIPSNDDIRKYDKDEPESMEEAVRLFYVAMTRAKSRLTLLTCARKDGAPIKESRFVTAVRSFQEPVPSMTAGAESRGARKPGERSGSGGSEGYGQGSRSGRSLSDRRTSSVRAAEAVDPDAYKRFPHLQAGELVRHSAFGQGRVVAVNSDTIRVAFGAGEKRLSTLTCIEKGLLQPAGTAII